MVLAAAAIEVVFSIYLLKTIDMITVIKMRSIAVLVFVLMVAAIVLRAKYEYFGPLQDTNYSRCKDARI
jgi:hypothetical protein